MYRRFSVCACPTSRAQAWAGPIGHMAWWLWTALERAHADEVDPTPSEIHIQSIRGERTVRI